MLNNDSKHFIISIDTNINKHGIHNPLCTHTLNSLCTHADTAHSHRQWGGKMRKHLFL